MPSTSRSRGSSGGSQGPPRAPLTTPMSERQQMALVMQLTCLENQSAAAPTPAEERKRSRQQRNERGETPLHVAAIKGDHELVQKLLDQGLEPDVADFAGWTALHEACSYGWYQVVEVLVKGGANVNAKGLDDDTPLHDAATSGNLKMVQYLIDNGADPNIKNTKGKTPADYAAQDIYAYLIDLQDNNTRLTHLSRSRDDSGVKKSGNASGSGGEAGKRYSMEGLAHDLDGKQGPPPADTKDEGHNHMCSNVSSSTQDEPAQASRRFYDDADGDDEDVSKRKKRKDEEKEVMAKPAPVQRSGTGRVMTGNKLPGPASKTGAAPLGKSGSGQAGKGSGGGKGSDKSGSKGGSGGKVGAQGSHQGKSGSKGQSQSKDRQKSPVASPKAGQSKDHDGDDDNKVQESSAPKVPPLKIVIPGGGAGNREQEGEGQRGSGKGRGGSSTLPYVIPSTAADAGHASDSSDTNSDEKRDLKAAQRVLRSHRNDDRNKKRSPQRGQCHSLKARSAHRSPPPGSGHDGEHNSSNVSNIAKPEPMELHPRKRKLKASKESHSREPTKSSHDAIEAAAHAVQHSNPYQMYIHIRKQIDQRQKSLFPVKPKPPKDFNNYLMNRCTYTLQSNVNAEPQIEFPINLPPQMKEEFISQEKERHRLRIQHLVEKEKLVLAVEQEILRVHGRAERAVANQSLPFSVCTMLRDKEVYNVLAPEQEEKRNAQRSRCNGRQINSWLQEVDDKWEKIKEGMLRRQHTEAETLYAVQSMGWEWKLKEVGLCDYKTTPKIDPMHVPQVHVSNFDLPA